MATHRTLLASMRGAGKDINEEVPVDGVGA